MAKGDGVVLNIIGLILGIISLFLVFVNSGTPPQTGAYWISYYFTHIDYWFGQLGNIQTYFSSINGVYVYLILLFPILFILAGICILAGIRGSGATGFGAFIFLLYPIGYLVLLVIVPAVQGVGNFGDLLLTVGYGLWLLLLAGILCAIGASKNSEG